MWYKQAQQGRLNLDTQTGVENFREELKALIGKSLVRNKLNPLQFVINFDKLRSLLASSPLNRYVKNIQDIKTIAHLFKEAGQEVPTANFDPRKKIISIPKIYNVDNMSPFLHEVVHAIDPLTIKKSLDSYMDDFRPYFNQRRERLAFFEDLDEFYSSGKLKKVLEIFYIKDKKNYPTLDIARKAFMDDFKNYTQNFSESILFNPSRFHSYLVSANNDIDTVTVLLSNSYKPFTREEFKKIFGDLDPTSPDAIFKVREYLKKHPERRESRDVQYYKQLSKFFSNVYTNIAKEIMPAYKGSVKPFNVNSTTLESASKSWLAKFLSKTKKISLESSQEAIDYFTYQRRDFFNKFISTLRTLNIVLDESFNFQDPRWQILEPIVELMLAELIKYLENPQQYKTNLQTDEQKIIKQLNKEIDLIINDKKIKDKKAYFLEHWSDSLKKLGTLEQNELLGKFPSMSFDQGINIMRNIGQK